MQYLIYVVSLNIFDKFIYINAMVVIKNEVLCVIDFVYESNIERPKKVFLEEKNLNMF